MKSQIFSFMQMSIFFAPYYALSSNYILGDIKKFMDIKAVFQPTLLVFMEIMTTIPEEKPRQED